MKENSWIRYIGNARVATDAEKVSEESEQENKKIEKSVRVNIQIEAGADKKEVIERISKEALNGSKLDIQNKDIAEDMFTANIPQNSMEAVEAVSGVQSVTLVEADGLTEEGQQADSEKGQEESEQYSEEGQEESEQYSEKSQNVQVIQKEKENNTEISTGAIVGLIFLILVLVLLVGRKLHKRIR